MDDSKLHDIAKQSGFSTSAVHALWQAMQAGNGRQAQFSHPELGGMGQWSGGMIMIGDMSNSGLKDRVARLCSLLSELPVEAVPAAASSEGWWPSGLGAPSSTGAQNSMRYACFPQTRRLAVERDGVMTVYDTGEHRLSGFSQAQSSSQTLKFSSQIGTVGIEDFRVVSG